MSGRYRPRSATYRSGIASTPGRKLPPQAAPEQLRFVFSADVAQLVERVHGKDEVKGSSPFVGSLLTKTSPQFCIFLSAFVLGCPEDERPLNPDQEPKMPSYLAVGRLDSSLMVRKGQRFESAAGLSYVGGCPGFGSNV
jgi:hypothetical protein